MSLRSARAAPLDPIKEAILLDLDLFCGLVIGPPGIVALFLHLSRLALQQCLGIAILQRQMRLTAAKIDAAAERNAQTDEVSVAQLY